VTTPLLLVVDEQVGAHLTAALTAHIRGCRRDAIPVPAELAAFLEVLAASRGPQRPVLAAERRTADAEAVLLSYAAAGARLGISARTVRRRVAEGRLPVVRDGRRRLIRIEDVAGYGREAA
jgi:excisionase family DNA binding protein